METGDINELLSQKTVLDKLSYALQKSLLCDQSFIVGKEGKGEIIAAHRLILSLSSPVFFAMFNGSIETDKQVVVPDVDPEAFRALLR